MRVEKASDLLQKKTDCSRQKRLMEDRIKMKQFELFD